MLKFTDEQLERYSRNILLSNVGIDGQLKITKGRVLIVGVGGLGSPAALYLAAAGVGTIGLADAEVVDMSNLQRQIIHFTPDLCRPKVESAAEKIGALNPEVKVITYQEAVTVKNITNIIKDYDFIIDAVDNFESKFLINDACVIGNKPFSHAGVLRFNGQTITVLPGKTACCRCLFAEPPPKEAVPLCSQSGVLGAVAGILGTIQATEALKYLVGIDHLLFNKLLAIDAAEMYFRTISINKNSHCPVCGDHPAITDLKEQEVSNCAAINRNS